MISRHLIEPLWDVVLSRGDEVLLSLIVVIVGMDGSVFERLKSVGHSTRRRSRGDDRRP